MTSMNICAFSINQSHDDNYGITHSTVLVNVVKDIEICQSCIGRILAEIGRMHQIGDWIPKS